MCHLFPACLYFEEDILKQNRYGGATVIIIIFLIKKEKMIFLYIFF